MNKGTLFLVVGNSGSGKDAVISYVLKQVNNVKKIKRYITRPESNTEDFISIKKENFNQKDYFLSWQAYNKNYGIRKDVLIGLEQGQNYIVNISRQVINEAREKWSNTKLIEFQVPFHILQNRLNSRGRESSKEILKRMERALNAPTLNADIIIDSSNPDVRIAGEQLKSFIVKIIN